MMETTVEWRPRLRGRIAALFYLLNIISGSLALVFIGRKPALYAHAANLTATISYVIVTVLFYSIFRPVNRRVSLLAAISSLMGCAVGAMNSFRPGTLPVNALAFFGVYCLLIGYLISNRPSCLACLAFSCSLAVWVGSRFYRVRLRTPRHRTTWPPAFSQKPSSQSGY